MDKIEGKYNHLFLRNVIAQPKLEVTNKKILAKVRKHNANQNTPKMHKKMKITNKQNHLGFKIMPVD